MKYKCKQSVNVYSHHIYFKQHSSNTKKMHIWYYTWLWNIFSHLQRVVVSYLYEQHHNFFFEGMTKSSQGLWAFLYDQHHVDISLWSTPQYHECISIHFPPLICKIFWINCNFDLLFLSMREIWFFYFKIQQF